MHTLYRRVNKFINYEWCAWLPACLYHLSPIQPVGVAFCNARTLSVSARGRICVQLCWDRQVFARGAAAVAEATSPAVLPHTKARMQILYGFVLGK